MIIVWKKHVLFFCMLQDLEVFLPDILAGQEEVDSFRPHSPDIKGAPRARTNTALQMRQKIMKGDQDQVKTVQWKCPPARERVDSESEELFPKKEIVFNKTPVSRLTQQLEQLNCDNLMNPWQEYGIYEGVPSREAGSKCVDIFPNITGDTAESAIRVWCGREARVKDVIGLTCLKYQYQGRPHHLQPPVTDYDLVMCEEDGTVDNDFPPLNQMDLFHKYGFAQLALVRKNESHSHALDRIILYLPDGSFTEVEVNKSSITIGDLLEMGLQRRARNCPRDRVGFTYHLETAEDSGVTLDPASSLGGHMGSEFYIVRDNSKRVSAHRDTSLPEKPLSWMLDAPLFQSFNVQIISKVRTKIDIHLGISGEKVEIDPQQQPTWSVYKQKACTYDMDNIVSCEVVSGQTEERKVFKMIYLTESGWRWTEFEGESDTVDAVIGKVNHLLDLRQTQARKLRKEYLENKEKKKSRRLSVK